jgi:hypothetical protein
MFISPLRSSTPTPSLSTDRATTPVLSQVNKAVCHGLIGLDRFLDCVPLCSVVNGVVDLGVKLFLSNKESSTNCYFDHLKNKSKSTCMLYTIPVIGNAVAISRLLHPLPKPQEPETSLSYPFPPVRSLSMNQSETEATLKKIHDQLEGLKSPFSTEVTPSMNVSEINHVIINRRLEASRRRLALMASKVEGAAGLPHAEAYEGFEVKSPGEIEESMPEHPTLTI